ncbi:APC membrane recruitment protein 2 isoform X1 [Plectropomus leopardus]|uniref:APC membrane recruitment protein 2 isoform X1 n=1 Tax=Plectropomus leopardus TaxID=160734 RepID=UPI001C4CB2AE|nr:APC membrane recruitment protein 2 isoform X1 [Plectropomus leopardus]
MDVQTENTDPPPCESQSSGKIRKGFKLFGKRKPGNIFSIRGKGDGNNKSPVIRSKTIDGLSETAAPDSEQETEKEKAQEVGQGEREQAEEEPLGEDGVLAAAPARASISSASSAKSLSFLSLLRGGRRGVGDRRVHTVSQPVGRQRRGLKGLFGNVKFRSKDKEEKEEAPPSPLLMSSRANSVEIIKEDLPLTPKSHPRSLDSPETESYDPDKNLATQDSATTSPSETHQMRAGNVSRTDESVPPLPTSEPPLVPGDTSLSCLLADISSLLTFDSITGGGDIMADVEAEWGKASSPVSAVVTEIMPSSPVSKPTISSPSTSTTTAKPSTVAVPTTASTTSSSPLTRTTATSSPIAKPSSIITTLTKSSTLTTNSVKLSSQSTPASEPSASDKIKSTPTPSSTKPSTTPVTLTSFLAPVTASSSMTIKSSLSTTSSSTTAPPNTPATVIKAPSASPTLSSTASKLASEIASPPQTVALVSKPIPVATPTPASTKPPPVTHSPPTTAAFTQLPPAKLDSASLNLQTSYKPALSSAAGESKAQVTPGAFTTNPSDPPPYKMTPVNTLTMTSGSVSVALSKPTLTSSPMDLSKPPTSLVSVPDVSSSTASTRPQPSSAPVPTPSSTSIDKTPPMTKPSPAPVSIDKMPPAPIPTTTTHAVISAASSAPPVLGQMPVSVPKDPPAPSQMQLSQAKTPPAPVQIPISVSKPPPVPAQIPISVPKDPPASVPISVPQTKAPPAQIPFSAPKDPPAPAHIQVSQSRAPPAPAQIPVSVSKDPPAQIPFSVPKDPPAPAQIPISAPKDPPAPAHIQVSQSRAPPAPAQIPVSVSKDPPAQIPIPQSKAPSAPTSAPCPVPSPSSPPVPLPSEAPAFASGQTSVDGQLTSPSSTGAQGAQTVPSKREDLQNESRASTQGPSKESRIPQVKASGLSKIPVVGGGRAGKLPVRDSQHDDEASREPPTPVLEDERPHFNSHDTGSKDKISNVDANVPTSKHAQEESQQLPQPKVLTSLPRDSKIPVKHGAQSHTGSQIPQAKEPSRTKIPVSKVPVRRVGNKPAAAGGSTPIRK